jgi:hypothetical protein
VSQPQLEKTYGFSLSVFGGCLGSEPRRLASN